MADEVVSIVDPDNGNNTDYTSLVAWESGEQKNLVAANEIAVAEGRCTGGSPDTGSVTANGFTGDNNCYMVIRTDQNNYRWDGVSYPGNNENIYRLEISDANACIYLRTASHIVLDGIAFAHGPRAVAGRCIAHYQPGAQGNFYVRNCIFRSRSAPSTGGQGVRQYTGGSNGNTYLWNCIAENWLNTGTESGGFSTKSNVLAARHCIARNCYRGYIRYGGWVQVWNSIAANVTVGVSGAANDLQCILSDGAYGNNNLTLDSTNNYENEFYDFANNDCRLVGNSQALNNAQNSDSWNEHNSILGVYFDYTDMHGNNMSDPYDIGPYDGIYVPPGFDGDGRTRMRWGLAYPFIVGEKILRDRKNLLRGRR